MSHLTQTTLLWLATMALLVDYVGLARANGAKSQIVSFGSALVLWGAFAINATNFVVYSGGSEFYAGAQTLPVVGVIFGFATLVLLFEAVMRAVKGNV
jgi:hypothetical protein